MTPVLTTWYGVLLILLSAFISFHVGKDIGYKKGMNAYYKKVERFFKENGYDESFFLNFLRTIGNYFNEDRHKK